MDELLFLFQYAKTEDLKTKICVKQLRCLWTAYCLHKGIEPDTLKYDDAIVDLWIAMSDNCNNPWTSKEFERFDLFMGEWLS